MKKSRLRKLMERRRREQMRRDGTVQMPKNRRHKSKKDYRREKIVELMRLDEGAGLYNIENE